LALGAVGDQPLERLDSLGFCVGDMDRLRHRSSPPDGFSRPATLQSCGVSEEQFWHE